MRLVTSPERPHSWSQSGVLPLYHGGPLSLKMAIIFIILPRTIANIFLNFLYCIQTSPTYLYTTITTTNYSNNFVTITTTTTVTTSIFTTTTINQHTNVKLNFI